MHPKSDALLLAPEIFATDGGIARILRLYLKALCETAGTESRVHLVALNDSLVDSTELRKYSTSRLADWRVCGRSKRDFITTTLRMGRQVDRVVCGHVAQLPVAWAASKLNSRMEYYLVAHGIEVWRPFTLLERRALKGARRIFCVSDYTRQQLLGHCPLPEGRAVVLPNALDPHLAPKVVRPASETAPIILSISRLSIADGYKGINHLIAAIPEVLEAIPEARLRIVGRGDGLVRLQAQVAKLKIGKAVQFTGFRSDQELNEDLDSCRIFALPSRKEGFGLVYLEAMAHGRPCLGARSGGVPEVITPGTGELIEYGDVHAISTALIAGLRRKWDIKAILDRAAEFSYLRFKGRLASLLLE
ncbi:MAG TPA: glycosyltransferase family 4 protein [Opitutaceae bacterium]